MNPPHELPSGFVFPPIIDPDQAGPPFVRGQAVQVDGVTIVYEETSREAERYVARFRISGTLPSPIGTLFILPGGPSAELTQSGDVVSSEPFALTNPEPSTLFSWRIGSQTLVWELGQTEG